MQVSINQPAYPYRTNRYYRHLLDRLADKNIYDVSAVAIGRRQSFYSASAIMSAVASSVLSATLAPGTYFYTVVGVTAYGETLPAKEYSVTVTSPQNAVTLVWTAIPSVTSYRIFRTTVPGQYANQFISETNLATIVDTGYATSAGYPLASVLKVTGSVTPAALYDVQLYRQGAEDQAPSPMAQTVTKPDGTFEFNASLPRGENEVYAVVSSERSASIFVNVYNIHLFFEAFANEMLNNWQEMAEQDRADIYINPTQDIFDTSVRYPTGEALRDVWGYLTDAFRPQSYTSEQYRQIILTILTAYRQATTYAAIKTIYDGFQTLSTPDYKRIVFYGKDSYTFKIGNRFGFRAVRTFGVGNPTLDYSWTGGNLHFNGQRGYIPNGTGTLPSGYGIHVIYIDGSRDSNGYFNLKVVSDLFNTLVHIPGLPDGVKVLAVFKTAGSDIVDIYGQCFIRSYATSSGDPYTGPFHIGPTFIARSARIMSSGFRGSRFLVYMTPFGLGPFADPEYSQKTTMIANALKAVKPAKTTIAYGYAPIIGAAGEI